mmetsp:Transcript_33304/g.48881  ORF Transcript_33304/g.48881 Transcript_33304/m.48881 type:complete len:502 (+) Transcript_33304:1043-2548(+)
MSLTHTYPFFVEQSCGGLISSSIMSVPGSSSVYYGGSIAYNSKKTKPLLLNNDALHSTLLQIGEDAKEKGGSEAQNYMESKLKWTAEASVAFCKELQTDYCIAEGGATGPTFRPSDLTTGFAAIAVAGKCKESGKVKVLDQQLVKSDDADREGNMRLFADAAATLAAKVISEKEVKVEEKVKQVEIYLDRCTHLRTDEAALDNMKYQANYILLSNTNVLVSKDDTTQLQLLSHTELLECVKGSSKEELHSKMIFLGRLHNDINRTPIFALDAKEQDIHVKGGTFVNTRTSAPLFSTLHNELALHATAYTTWQSNNKHCTKCGGPINYIHGGTCSKCTSCSSLSWPRQDPSMIALISSRDGNRVLLARSPRHPPRLHTVLAGFVEVGETFESAVARETFEETGITIDVDSVRYVGSQPWPFPQSCMIGFMATADDTLPLTIDEKEIVSAGWFDKSVVKVSAGVKGATMQEKVANEVDGSIELLIPPKGVIARKLIDLWLEKS